MTLGVYVNKNLCIVISREILNELLWCTRYTDDFLIGRMEAYYKHGLSTKATHRISTLYREFRIWGFSNVEMKYAIAGQYVISYDDTKVGSWMTDAEAGSILTTHGSQKGKVVFDKSKSTAKKNKKKNKKGGKGNVTV